MPFAHNQGVKIFYSIEGDGPPLVLLHGFTDTHESWIELGYVDALKNDFQLILIDGRGHGRSDKPHDPEAYPFHVCASDIVAVLDALEIPKAHFFGYSWGGKIGFALANHYGERFASLTIGGSAPDGSIVQIVDGNDPMIERLSLGSSAIPSLWDMELSNVFRERLQANDTEALIAVRKGRMLRAEGWNAEQAMPVPCLLLAGETDPSFAAVQKIAAELPSSQMVSFPGLNHAGTFFSTNLLVPILKEFIAKHPIGPPHPS